ncbi:DUF3035 domain-containing protein [Kordiimonas lipolytica]|uniref:DUF3035 domain-containing protein n=1 Tax=Kordiimonas lipolytica TaxID=1662421 RepID=A0ABV8UCN2_9PROT|nr:DUF3035 domain-containing protein [Kordiimonas lipolytica]
MNLKSVLFIGAAALTLAACGGGKNSPDEFEVVSRAPLVVPPEADLSPPRPGEPNAQTIDASGQAYEALFPGKKFKRSEPKSDSERDLLSRVGPSEPDVRSNVGQKDLAVVKKTLLLADILDAEEREFRTDNVSVRRVSSGS